MPTKSEVGLTGTTAPQGLLGACSAFPFPREVRDPACPLLQLQGGPQDVWVHLSQGCSPSLKAAAGGRACHPDRPNPRTA